MNLVSYLKKEDYKLGTILKYPKGSIIKQEQEICQEAYFVLKGEIKISSYQLNGKEDIYNIIKEQEIFANNLIFSDNNYYLGNVIALKDVELLKIDKEALLKILSNNLSFLKAYCENYAKEIIKEKIKLKILLQKNIEERLCYFLNLNNGSINLSITKLSEILYLQRPSLSRVISSLIQNGIIKKEGKRITLLKDI